MNGSIRWVAFAFVVAGGFTHSLADEKSHRAAAEEVLKLANTERVMATALETMLDAQVKADPNLEPVKGVMRKFLAKHLSYAAVKEDLITLYASEFTEEELNEIAAFYRTPTGKKAVEKLPFLFQKGGEIGARRVQENLPELQQLIEAQLKRQAGESPRNEAD